MGPWKTRNFTWAEKCVLSVPALFKRAEFGFNDMSSNFVEFEVQINDEMKDNISRT